MPMTKDDWIEAYGGVRIPVLKMPPRGTFKIENIAYGLAGEWRFSGQTFPRLTVAEHSVRVAELLHAQDYNARLQMLGLLHDAPEGCGLRDMATPIKVHLRGYKEIEDRWFAAILRDLGIALPTIHEAVIVQHADQIETITEAAAADLSYQDWLMYREGIRPDEAAGARIKFHPPLAAESLFAAAYERLKKEIDDDRI
jgi:5'-deoxynucleotidase YfbR-like HD superfamily hydrolase